MATSSPVFGSSGLFLQFGSDSEYEFRIICKPSTYFKDVEEQLGSYYKIAEEILVACLDEDPEYDSAVLQQFCEERRKWLEEEHDHLSALEVLMEWQQKVDAARGQYSDIATHLPPIVILR